MPSIQAPLNGDLTSQEGVDKLLEAAGGLIEQGRFEDGISQCRRVLRLDPGNAVAVECIAEALERQGKLGQAMRAYRASLRLDPSDWQAHTGLARVLERTGRISDARRIYEKALEQFPDDPAILCELGRTLAKQRRYEESEATLEKARSLEPKDPIILYNLAATFDNAGDNSRAITGYQEVLVYDPSDWDAVRNLGFCYWKTRCYAEAVEVLERLHREGDRGDEASYNNLGICLARLGDPHGAINCYRQAVQIDPRYDKGWYNLGLTYARQERWDEAQEAYQKALECKPGNKEILGRLAAIAKRRGAPS